MLNKLYRALVISRAKSAAVQTANFLGERDLADLDIRALPLLQRQLRTSSTNLMPLKRATKRVLSGIH